jgi:hypothetical protein
LTEELIVGSLETFKRKRVSSSSDEPTKKSCAVYSLPKKESAETGFAIRVYENSS